RYFPGQCLPVGAGPGSRTVPPAAGPGTAPATAGAPLPDGGHCPGTSWPARAPRGSSATCRPPAARPQTAAGAHAAAGPLAAGPAAAGAAPPLPGPAPGPVLRVSGTECARASSHRPLQQAVGAAAAIATDLRCRP